MSPSSPIIVLDSGLGGLTVVRALRKVLPGEDIVYFGDTARLPYGSKTAPTVTGFVQQIIAYLRPHDPKHVVIACNTATALSLPAVRAAFPGLAISGVIEPGAKAATAAAGTKQVPTIAILATEATIRSKAYERAVHRRRLHARMLLRPAPLLVPIIEEGRGPADPLVKLALQQYLEPLLKHHMDVLVLGCTHYPVYKELISKIVGKGVRVIDSGEQCADDVARRLKAAGLLNGPPASDMQTGDAPVPTGGLRCFVTDDPVRFQRLAPRFLGVEIDKPEWVAPDELYGPAPTGGVRLSVPA
ncbi:MAG TPA: glutamate racemase [Tepidisphaeraceae bacterium]|jgi:glutamate racemase|nr:glutamate racemase [Tepidisphaeraceae bacterium]